jgi:aquaporin Z
MPIEVTRRLSAEFFGTFWLTFARCGSAVLAAGLPSLGVRWVAPHLVGALGGVVAPWQYERADEP